MIILFIKKIMQAKKPLGLMRNKTYLLVKYKEDQQEKQKR
jgi:hypothetical protein